MKKTQIEYIKAELEDLSEFEKWLIGKSCSTCKYFKKDSSKCILLTNNGIITRKDSLCECYIKKN